MKKTTVAVLFGGKSGEHEVSGRSAATILDALHEAGYRTLPIGITREGSFYLFRGSRDHINSSLWETTSGLVPVWFSGNGSLLSSDGRTYSPDVVFPVLHGQCGEDGGIQGFLDTLGVPYVGCGIAASVLSWDKALAKAVARSAGVPTLPWVATERAGAEERILKTLSFPIFIKPAASGSSIGAARADDMSTLTAALDASAPYGTILAEPCFRGRELEIAVLDDGDILVSRVGEIDPGAVFYDYETKYRADTAHTYIPARIPSSMADRLRGYAERMFRALGCRHLARIDFFADDEQLFFNEINTMPGFTSISMYPRLMADSGVPLGALVTRLVEGARS